jgi:hypothetical protein
MAKGGARGRQSPKPLRAARYVNVYQGAVRPLSRSSRPGPLPARNQVLWAARQAHARRPPTPAPAPAVPLPAALPAVVSNQDSRDVVLKCLSSGAADYWVRPIRPNEIRMLWTRVWRGNQVRALGGSTSWAGTRCAAACRRSSWPARAGPFPASQPLPHSQTATCLPACLPACSPPASCPPLMTPTAATAPTPQREPRLPRACRLPGARASLLSPLPLAGHALLSALQPSDPCACIAALLPSCVSACLQGVGGC